MRKYIKPNTEIIPSMTAENLLLKGSDDVNRLDQQPTDLVVGGDDNSSNTFNKSLWDEE